MRETVLPLVRRSGHPEPHGAQEEVLLGQMPLGLLEVRDAAQGRENGNGGGDAQ